MGIFYLDHFDSDEYYACAACETHLCNPERIVSKVSDFLVSDWSFFLGCVQQFHG